MGAHPGTGRRSSSAIDRADTRGRCGRHFWSVVNRRNGGPETITRQTGTFGNISPFRCLLYNIQGGPPNSSGFDGGKKVKGRKRHLLVDTTGLVVKALVHPADVPDGAGGQRLLEAIADRAQALPPPAASVGGYGLSRPLQGLGGADAGLDGRGGAPVAPLGLGSTRSGTTRDGQGFQVLSRAGW